MNGNGARQSSSAESPAGDSGNGGSLGKRKADDGTAASVNGIAHTRAKRNRYISIACNECKRRKIKCNGNAPCQRCGNLNLECQYAPNCCTNGFKESEEFRQMNAHLANLQEQVDNLYANLNALRSPNGDSMSFIPAGSERSMSTSQPPPISPVTRYRPTPKHPSFRGPTSSAFSLDVAKNTLHSMGYQGLGDSGAITQDVTPMGSPPPAQTSIPDGAPSRDPLWSLSKEEVTRLCRVYEEEMGIMHPFVDIEKVIIHGRNFYDFIDAAVRTGLASNTPVRGKGVNDHDSLVLKMVVACATLVEGNGQSEIAYRLYESVREVADSLLHGEVIEIKNLPFLVLVCIYHFHCDEEALAWRIIGQVARMCIELGLHRRDSLFKAVTDEGERSNVIKLFWSIYVLDRRWSFGTGMPFAIQDADIDPNLPEPDFTIPYLNAMISYSRIGSKVWRSLCSFPSTPSVPLDTEEINYLDYQIHQWQKTIPTSLLLPTTSSPSPSPAPTRAVHRLQILLYLRTNQMRILIYRPVLHSASSIASNLSYASTVVSLAQDTIRALTHLNQTSDIYRAQQVCFNYFLIQALAVIFLASCHAPVLFSERCREEWYMALELVRGFSGKSFVSKRLWRTIKGLKEAGMRLGLSAESVGENGVGMEENPHSSAALAMAGLAGHEISGLGELAGGAVGESPLDVNVFQMSCEMTSLFEAALAHSGSSQPGVNNGAGMGGVGGGGDVGAGNGVGFGMGDAEGLGGVIGSDVFGGDEELYRQLRDLF